MAAIVDHQNRLVVMTQAEFTELLERAAESGAKRALAAQTQQATQLLTRKQCAHALGISVPSLDRHVSRGLPSVAVGSLRRFDLAAVQAWLARGRHAAE